MIENGNLIPLSNAIIIIFESLKEEEILNI